MSKKKESKALARKSDATSLDAVIQHPAFQKVAGQLSAVQKMLESLPAAIGEAVRAAQAQPPSGANAPAVPMVDGNDIKIKRGALAVDSAQTDVKKPVAAFSLQPTKSFPNGAPQREEWSSDPDYVRSIRDYEMEWRHEYQCRGCKDPICPQCGYRNRHGKD